MEGVEEPVTAPEEDAEEVLERARGLEVISPAAGGRSARLEGYFRITRRGKGGKTFSLSNFRCAGASSGVTGIGRLIVDDVDGVSTASLTDLDDGSPPCRVLDSEGVRRTPVGLVSSDSSSGMLSVNENADPTLLVLARPPPPFPGRFCHEVGGGGRALGIGLRGVADS